MRCVLAATLLLMPAIGLGSASAEVCPNGALGVSRTIVVDPTEHPRIGGLQYGETLPLNDKEVVLTFDDGPLPPHTGRVLETLASECVKATFFMVGQMANTYPALVRRVYKEGHTIGNHSQNHPFSFAHMSVDRASAEIQGGFASLRAALGEPDAVAPFFRIPGLLRQSSVEQYLADHHIMTWSLDVVADDWTHIGAQEIARRAISRLEAHGKGILLLHDIHRKTATALPIILAELKARGFKIVHVVPATSERPKTATSPEEWATRMISVQKLWPAVIDLGPDSGEQPVLPVPSPTSFGILEVAPLLIQSFASSRLHTVNFPSPPPNATYSDPVRTWPIAAREDFQYVHIMSVGNIRAEPKGTAGVKPASAKNLHHPGGARYGAFWLSTGTRSRYKPLPIGHAL
jgi:peptidoglycan-N-acetylglucosamine deacetylase